MPSGLLSPKPKTTSSMSTEPRGSEDKQQNNTAQPALGDEPSNERSMSYGCKPVQAPTAILLYGTKGPAPRRGDGPRNLSKRNSSRRRAQEGSHGATPTPKLAGGACSDVHSPAARTAAAASGGAACRGGDPTAAGHWYCCCCGSTPAGGTRQGGRGGCARAAGNCSLGA